MLRALRIAVSVVSGICCVLVIVLWVRSYWCNDSITRFNPCFQCIASEYGDLVLISSDTYWSNPKPWQFNAEPIGDIEGRAWWDGLRISHWFVIAPLAAIAILPWISLLSIRFSVRTLLFVITAVGILLGIITYATRG